MCDFDENHKKDESGQNIKYDKYIRDLTSNDEFLDAMNDVFLEFFFNIQCW